jgi:hypothetical protein
MENTSGRNIIYFICLCAKTIIPGEFLDYLKNNNFEYRSDLVETIGGIIKNNTAKIKQMMSGKGGSSAEFHYNGKTYQLGIDKNIRSRIRQFFEK